MTLPQRINIILLLLFMTVSMTGCVSLLEVHDGDPPPPPILAQDEIRRPYVKIGKIEITRNVYAHFDYMIAPDIMAWGLLALRSEAAKTGADAVILPEVTGSTFTFMFVPSTEYRITGEAIKFK